MNGGKMRAKGEQRRLGEAVDYAAAEISD